MKDSVSLMRKLYSLQPTQLGTVRVTVDINIIGLTQDVDDGVPGHGL